MLIPQDRQHLASLYPEQLHGGTPITLSDSGSRKDERATDCIRHFETLSRRR